MRRLRGVEFRSYPSLSSGYYACPFACGVAPVGVARETALRGGFSSLFTPPPLSVVSLGLYAFCALPNALLCCGFQLPPLVRCVSVYRLFSVC